MAKCFVSIYFPHLSTDWFALRRPELRSIPFVLCASSHGRFIITAVNNIAEQKGIHTGMVLADARAIHPELKKEDERPGLINKLLHRIAEWCIRFTPVAAVDPLGGIILDASGCTHLWNGDAAYITDIIKRINAKGFTAKAAIADTIGAAWAFARHRQRSCVIKPGKHIDAILPLPIQFLRIENNIVEQLNKLGIHQVRDLVAMQRASITRRFGKNVVLRICQAFGTEEEFITPVYKPAPYQERLPCLEPVSRLPGIEIGLQQMLELLCNRLQKESKGGRSFSFKAYRVDGKEIAVNISTTASSCHVKHLFKLFQLKLSSLEPGPGIELFTLEASMVEDYIPAQEMIWKQSTGLNDTRVAELIDRIIGKYGSTTIERCLPAEHYLPERSFRIARSLQEQPTTEWKSDRPRPIHLLSSPEYIEVTAPVPDYPPMMFRYKGILHKIIKADGPERIEQEWWLQDGQHRDYYIVEDENGYRYWLFRLGHYDTAKTYKWFLHGYFQ
jgi:protein ImuB